METSANQNEIKVSSAATADFSALSEAVKLNDSNTSRSKDDNLDENYNYKLEARYTGSEELTSTDIGTCLFVSKSILSGKPGQLRLSGGQANETDSGPLYQWYETAVLDCK